MLDIESQLGCATSFLKIISTSFSKQKVFSYSPNRLRRAFEIAETKWINDENDNDNDSENDNDSDNDNDNQGPVPERPISVNPGLKVCSISVFLFLFIALDNILCYHYCIS